MEPQYIAELGLGGTLKDTKNDIFLGYIVTLSSLCADKIICILAPCCILQLAADV